MGNNKRAFWSSRLAYIIAVSGSAVGLGNIWKFPYIAGQYGGGAFVLFYLLCVVAVGLPVMVAETLIGRYSHKNPADAVGRLAEKSDRSFRWQWLGLLTIASGFLILSFYSMIAGWALYYIYLSATNQFSFTTAAETSALFHHLTSSPALLILCHTVIMLVTGWVIAKGVQKGIERVTSTLLPMMIMLLIALVVYAINGGYFGQAFSFMFKADWSKLTPKAALVALGHAFFTLSLALGIVMTYGSYLGDKMNIMKMSFFIGIIDTVIALLAGLAIFPLVFSHGLKPGMGPGLIFQTLPIAFGDMPLGSVFATIFFVMLLFAALTSTISLLEPSVSLLSERLRVSRRAATIGCGFVIWLLGIGSILSLNVASKVTLFGLTFFDFIDYLTANIMLPLGGLGIALFVGYAVDKYVLEKELLTEGRFYYIMWRFSLRYIAPLGIFLVLLNTLSII